MLRGLAAPLSPNEETTLWRVRAATKLTDLDKRHVERLASLELVALDKGAVTLTVLGKRRIEDSLPPARAAAQKRREADLVALLGGSADLFALLDGASPKNAKPHELAPRAKGKA